MRGRGPQKERHTNTQIKTGSSRENLPSSSLSIPALTRRNQSQEPTQNTTQHLLPDTPTATIAGGTLGDDTQIDWAWINEANKMVQRAEEAAARTEEASRKRKPADAQRPDPTSPQPPPTKDRPTPNSRSMKGREALAKAAATPLPTRPALHTPTEQGTGAPTSDSEPEPDQRTWLPVRLDDPEEEEERMNLILEEEVTKVYQAPGATITKDHIEVVAKRTGADPAALWGLFKKWKYPTPVPAHIPPWPASGIRPPLSAPPRTIPEDEEMRDAEEPTQDLNGASTPTEGDQNTAQPPAAAKQSAPPPTSAH